MSRAISSRPRAGAGGLRRAMLALLVLAGLSAGGADAAVPPPRDYATADIIEGFMLTVFGREGPKSSQDVGRYVNRFVDPVTVYILDSSSAPGRTEEVEAFVRLLARTVPNLKIRLTDKPEQARLILFIVDRANYKKVIADALPKGEQTAFLERARCSTILWNRTTGVIDHGYVFILGDQGDVAFTSCLAEELTQALGPANDSNRLRDSLYNDTNDVGVFGLYDWFILSALYDDAILPGMTPDEAKAVLPEVIGRLRAWVPAVLPLLPSLGPRR